MSDVDFQIAFSYNSFRYIGVVRQLDLAGYSVLLENENHEFYLEFLLKPSASLLEEWEVKCGEGEDASNYYDKEFLAEIALRIQAQLN